MSWRASSAIAKHEFRIQKTDMSTPIFMILMPLLMMAFLKPVFQLALVDAGFTGANGAEQAVPGMAVMFSAFFTGYIGFSFLREHGWGTWDRLRASPATSVEIMVGKVGPPLLIVFLQLTGLFVVGALAFQLKISGSILAIIALIVMLSLCFLAFGMTITALSRTTQQLNAFSSIGAIVFAFFGGALSPTSAMPGWAQAVGPATPAYWAMKGFRTTILEGGGLGDVALPIAMLTLFTAAFAAIAALKFNFEETKAYFG